MLRHQRHAVAGQGEDKCKDGRVSPAVAVCLSIRLVKPLWEEVSSYRLTPASGSANVTQMPETRSRQTGTRRRRAGAGSGAVIQDLTSSVNELIRQNKALKQQLARLQGHSTGGGTAASRELLALQRRLSRTLDGKVTKPSAASRTRRQISDPAVLQARRAALAKAREALAAKRAAQRGSRS
jgi:hypothetical protein